MNILLTWHYSLFFTCINLLVCTRSISCKCHDDQMSILLEFRSSLQYDNMSSTKLNSWDRYTDCCQWDGVVCDDAGGRVTGLDLSNEIITSRLDNSSALFRLQSLNLAFSFCRGKMPSSLSKLTSLRYLNLSLCFEGDIPREIAHLGNLVTLDISVPRPPPYYLFSPLILPSTTFASMIQNMTHVKALHLNGVSGFATWEAWEAVSTVLPGLQVLTMYGCDIAGMVPGKIFQVATIEVLDLSNNFKLEGTLPNFLPNQSLQELVLSYNKFSGILSNSISNLKRLRRIDISNCNFHGRIPATISNLDQLEYVDLSSNSFTGPIPSFSSAQNLTQLNLANNLNGSITFMGWGSLLNLAVIDLSNNSLTGKIPMSLFSLPLLRELVLGRNKFSGQLNGLPSPNIHSPRLKNLDLSYNSLRGPISKSIFQFTGLEKLDLSWNNFEGKLKLGEILGSLKNVTLFALSHNCLSINANDMPTYSSFPKLYTLGLASCNLKVLPKFLRSQPSLAYLDLSDNKVQGTVANWVWEVGAGNLIILNLSCNNFVGLDNPSPRTKLFKLSTVDLHSNNLQGELPVISSKVGLLFLDYSNNNFTSINPDIGNSLSSAVFFSSSKNNIAGNIPRSLCHANLTLDVLDLGYNQLTGEIPNCVISMSKTLGVLNLRGNNLVGVIPDKFGEKCRLHTLSVNKNSLQGLIPRSLDNCKNLKFLDLGNNQLSDTFPCELKTLSKLKVLILKANKFHGTISCTISDTIWPSLQIFDVGSNHFNGELTSRFLFRWRSMTTGTSQVPSQLNRLQYHVSLLGNFYYQDVVTVTAKHSQLILQEILTTFTSIDLSDNAFIGQIPKDIGVVTALVALNLSHNFFEGNIPSSLSNLTQLESLDISCNAIGGTIPLELANLNFLEYLNLSFNRLSGQIPKGTQLQSFDSSSYEGNQGLYGPPLTAISRTSESPQRVQSISHSGGIAQDL